MLEIEAYTKLIEKAKICIPSGASFTGDLSERVRKLFSLAGEEAAAAIVAIQPGDYIRTGSNKSPGISLAAPIGYDIWYLFPTANVLNFEDAEDDARTDEILERLEPFLSALQDIKPLKTIRDKADLSHHDWWSWPSSMSYWENSAPYMIKEMRYETVLNGKGFKYYSEGMPEGSIGYLAFPIGQLGVMEIVSLIGESVTEDASFSIAGEEGVIEAGGMMAPVHNNRGYCIGEHLIEGGYLIQDSKIELMSEDFEGQESVAPHKWLRYWIDSEDTFPVPGEFVALLTKSELFHIVWFQETYPFLYSGQYWESEYYTSGIIKEVIEPDDESEEETSIYRVWVRGYEMYLRPSDFAEYEVNDRVAIVKETLDLIDNMDWTLIESDKNNNSSSKDSPDEDWVIVPVSFYK